MIPRSRKATTPGRRVGASIALALAAMLPLAAKASDEILVENVFGHRNLQVIRAGKKEREEIVRGATLQAGDEIGTDRSQIITLSSSDGSQWKLGPISRLRIDKSEPGEGKPRLFSLLRGTLWGRVPGEKGRLFHSLRVRTTKGAVGLVSAEFLLEDRGALSGVDIVRGEAVWGNAPDFVEGSFVTVKAGQRSTIQRPMEGSVDVEAMKMQPTPPAPFKKGRDLMEHYELVGGVGITREKKESKR